LAQELYRFKKEGHMMILNKRRTRETLIGTGKIYKEEKNIATALYSLRGNQDFIVDDPTPGPKEYACQLSIMDGEHNLFDKGVLILQLMVGRRWKLIVTSGDIFSGNYKATSSSGEGPV
jgi:hypothetical protein